ncbi:MAG: hypothetical protein ABIH18_02765 [Candidatus Omnitrophota bacterium]
MDLLIKIKLVFKKMPCLTAGIFLFMSLLNVSFVQSEDGLKDLKQAGYNTSSSDKVVIEQRALEPVKRVNLENIKIIQETIDLRGLKSSISGSKSKILPRRALETKTQPHISLKSNVSAVSAPTKEKPKTNWIKGKIAVSGALLPAVEKNQSSQLEKLKMQSKKRKVSFEKSLEAIPSRESQLLKESTKGDNVQDNE